MTRFLALLRGVNVGKSRRVSMADLRALLSGMGYADVATLLNSGNAVFGAAGGTSAMHAAAIAGAISGKLRIEVHVIVKSAKELAAVALGNPLAESTSDDSRLLVAFAQDAKSLASLAVIESLVVRPERFVMGKHAAYLLCARGMLESKAAKALLGKAGQAATTRNWATTLKLHALASERVG